MNYKLAYESLIAGASSKSRAKGNGEYFEKHHVVPRAVGGGNEKENLVLLSGKEHYVAHHLLARMHPQIKALQRAFWAMCHIRGEKRSYRVTSAVYEAARKEFSAGIGEVFSKARSGVPLSYERRVRLSEALKGNQHTLGYRHSADSRKKISDAGLGRKRSKESIAQSVANRPERVLSEEDRMRCGDGMRGKIHTEKTKALMSDSHKGRVKSPEHRERLRQALLGRKRGSWFTDGTRNTIAKECPEGFWPGQTRVFGAVVEGEPGTN
jgi:hypothetical protein